jgi:hypothetical protein
VPGAYTLTVSTAVYPTDVITGVAVVSGTTTVQDAALTAPYYHILLAIFKDFQH